MRFGNSRESVELTGRSGATYDGEKSRWLNAFWLHLEPDDAAFTVHWRDGFWESWITAWMDGELDDHDVFVDVGANVGYYAFMAASQGKPVLAFEPQRHLANLLWKSKESNKDKLVTINDFALSDGFGIATLSAPTAHSGAGSITGTVGDNIHTERVRTLTFDSIAEHYSYKRWLIKIDAEGAEPLIWKGMEQFRSQRVFTVILEWAPSRYEDPRRFAEELLHYEVTLVNGDGAEQPVTMDSLLAVQDFEMIVVRN